jgi:hypothetical protein
MIRMALVRLLLQQYNRPRDGWQVLSSVYEAFLDPSQIPALRQLRAEVQKRPATAG